MKQANNTEKIKKIAEEVVNLTIQEVNVLVDTLKNDYGIEPIAAGPAVTMAVNAVEKEEKKEEKTIFDVILESPGNSKLSVIKAVKDILGLGLKEAKDLVDSAPQPIKEGIPKEEAENIQKELAATGAEVKLK